MSFETFLIAAVATCFLFVVVQMVGELFSEIRHSRFMSRVPAHLVYKTVDELRGKSRELDAEAERFMETVRGRPCSQWGLGKHAWYASIRRREEELDITLSVKAKS